MKKLIIAAAIAATPVFAFAHGNKMDIVKDSVGVSFAAFAQEESDAIKKAFNGVKAWPSGAKIMVKIYLKDMEAMAYKCGMDHSEGRDEVVCQKEIQE